MRGNVYGIVINIVARASRGLGSVADAYCSVPGILQGRNENLCCKDDLQHFLHVLLIHACCYVSGMLLGRGNDTIVALIITVH